MHVYSQYHVHIPIRQVLMRFEHDWTKMHMEKIWKRFHEIKYWKQWIQRILCIIFNLICSIHIQESRPNALTLQAAQKINIQTCKNSQKAQIWKLVFRSIQAPILVLSSSWDIIERFSITNINQNALNWYP